MTYLNSYNTRRNALSWPSSFGSIEQQLDSLLASFPSFVDLEKTVGTFDSGSRVRARWYEKDDAYLVRFDLPGVAKDAIVLELEDGYLKVTASRKYEQETPSVELESGFKVPEQVDAEKISAAYQDGVLSLTLPKAEKAKPRQIKLS